MSRTLFDTPDTLPPVSQSDLEFLRDPDPHAENPYQGVYRDGDGWQARAFKRRVGPVQPSPREAAKTLVRWWRARYGERWRAVYAHRQATGWVPLRVPGGVLAVVYLDGGRAVLVGAGGEVVGGAAGYKPFRDRAAAAAGVRAWARGRFGAEAPLRVRRAWTPSHNPHRATAVR